MAQIHITWDNFDSAANTLIKKIVDQDIRIDYIAAIARGGLVPGVYLSHNLDLPLHVISWSTRDQPFNKRAPLISGDLSAGSHILLLDDINDTGRTFEEIIKYCDKSYPYAGKLVVASVYQRYNTNRPSDVYGCSIESDDWVVFPWEVQ